MAHIAPHGEHITYQRQYRKCGKPCKTCQQGKGHGPYWYADFHEGSRLHTGYVGRVLPPGAQEPRRRRSRLAEGSAPADLPA